MEQMNDTEALEFAKKVTENHYLCWCDNPDWRDNNFSWKKFSSINETNLHTQALLRHIPPNSPTYNLIMQTGAQHCQNILKQNNLL